MIMAFENTEEREKELALFKEYLGRCCPRDMGPDDEIIIRNMQMEGASESVLRHARAE
jgi:hypothetical protein